MDEPVQGSTGPYDRSQEVSAEEISFETTTTGWLLILRRDIFAEEAEIEIGAVVFEVMERDVEENPVARF